MFAAPFRRLVLPLSLTSFTTPVAWRSLRLLNAPFGRFCNMCSLTSFICTCSKSFLRSLDAPFGHFCNMCSLTSFVRTCSKSFLWSLTLPLVADATFGCLTLPLVTFATCAHSLRSFALVAKAPYARLVTCPHSLCSFALVAPKGCSIGLYCELQVVFASLRFAIWLSLAQIVVPYVSCCSPYILNIREFVQSIPFFP